jgi:aspartate racemase
VFSPGEKEIERINELLFTEMEHGIFKDSSRLEILEIVQKMIDSQNVDAVILGCTEFPILFREKEYLGLPFLNTTRIHVEEIIDRSISS